MPLPVQNYSPSGAALQFVKNTYPLALDLFNYSDVAGTFINFVLVQQAPNGKWEYVGNIAPAGAMFGNAGLIWQLHIDTQIAVYAPPGQPIWAAGDAVSCMNQFRSAMITDHLPGINKLMADVFGGGAIPTPPPAAEKWPVSTWSEGQQSLAWALHDKLVFNGTNIVIK